MKRDFVVMKKEKLFKDQYSVYVAFYIFCIALTVVAFVVSISSELTVSDSTSYSFINYWYEDEDMTVSADIEHPELETNVVKSFYAKVPNSIVAGDSIMLKLKHGFISVYLEDELVAEVTESNSSYEKSPGRSWITVPLETSDIGKTIKIEIYTTYDNSAKCRVDTMYIGSTVDMYKDAITSEMASTIISIMIVLIGIVLILTYVSLSLVIKNLPKELLYLGLFSTATALWSFLELKVVQLLVDHAGALHSLSCMTLMLIAFPLYMLFRKDVGKSANWLVPIVSWLTILNITICTVLYFTGTADLYETLKITHIVLGVSAIGIVYANYVICFKTPNRTWADMLAGVGMVTIAIGTAIDLYRYKVANSGDAAKFVRLALLIYVITLSIRSVERLAKIMEKGIKAEIISHLAYEDGLTGLGNRTAYKEKISTLKNTAVSIFMFDVNNLKDINDTLGHAYGDELITDAADAIKSVFGQLGSCYRIGGDEFVVLIEDECESDKLMSGLTEFIDAGNTDKIHPLSVAGGFSYYNGKKGSIENVIADADKRMYNNKKAMKEEAKRIAAEKATLEASSDENKEDTKEE